MEIKLKLNGRPICAQIDADTVLLDFLRQHGCVPGKIGAHLLAVAHHLGAQRFQRVKPLFLAQSGKQAQPHVAAVELAALPVKQIGLDGRRTLRDGRVRADVDSLSLIHI